MPDLLIRGLDQQVADRLKAQAARNGVSMQAEAKAIIEAGVKPTMKEWLARVDEINARYRDPDRPRMTAEEIVALIHEGRDEREEAIEAALKRAGSVEP